MKKAWWKTQTGYQIYPRSFCDSNGDGIGDIPGIISKLDHLKDLGIGFVWLSPVYASPMRDNGYDISDYRDIAPEFGTMADFDHLLSAADEYGIKIVMDLVVNHCASDHKWFQAACRDATCPEHDYFYWRPAGADGGPPNDQRACFGGSAWHWVPAVQKYCYCHFGPQQPDLNWQNPALRSEIYQMMNWWLDKGLGGFRMDVIDLIGKDIDARIYHQGPDMYQFLNEMHEACFAGRDVLTVGEAWSATPETVLHFTGKEKSKLGMVFNFNHIEAAWDPIHGRFGENRFDLCRHKQIMNEWQRAVRSDGWNALYLSNHDLPRPVSHYANDKEHRVAAAKMLATVTYLMKGTPFVYQGEEIGMTNADFDKIDQFRDIETLGQFAEQVAKGVSEDEFVAGARQNGRDNARTPMQWDGSAQAGFTNGTPWIGVNRNYTQINVAKDRQLPGGIFAHYQALTALRQSLPLVTEGDFELLLPDHPDIFAYLRTQGQARMLVAGNYADQPVKLQPGALPDGTWTQVLPLRTKPVFPASLEQVPPYFFGVWLEGLTYQPRL